MSHYFNLLEIKSNRKININWKKYSFLFFFLYLFTNEISAQNDKSHLMVITSILPKKYIKTKQNLFFTIQIGAFKNNNVFFSDLENIVIYKEDGINKYRIGEFLSYQEAEEYKKMINSSCKGAFIVAIKNGKKITLKAALKEFSKVMK